MLQHLFVTAPKGLEELLAEELASLGALGVKLARAGVHCDGDLASAYRICLWSRLANRVLWPLAEFEAADADALYAAARQVPWSAHLTPEDTLAVDCIGTNQGIQHSHFGALRVKDAVVDHFRELKQDRPSVQRDQPDLRINLHLRGKHAALSLDLSGDSLHRRGYRAQGGPAPLKENLAAAILLRAGWPEAAADGGGLLDPLCGSGTLLIEGAWMAADRAPGLDRRHYGFLGWRQHDEALWQGLLEEARGRALAGLARLPPLLGLDRHARVLEAAEANAELAGLGGRIRFERRGLEWLQAPDWKGLAVTNPPYGERLGERDEVEALYATLGERLRTGFAGWRASVLTADVELGKQMGLRAHRMHKLYNGALECRLLHFEVTPENFVTPGPPAPPVFDAEQLADHPLANRLRKNLKHLRKWAKRERTECYRVYDADIPEYAVAVDRYGPYVHLQEYAPPDDVPPKKAERRLLEAVGVVAGVLESAPEAIFVKVRQRQKGQSQYQIQDRSGRFFEVQEGPARLLVNLADYLDTGLFLDHRPTRALVRKQAQGRRFLNLFCYTASVTVHAALGGAAETTSVDLSAVYLDWARRNLTLNGFDDSNHHLMRADCREWIAEDRGEYDLIFLDPPTFSNSKRMEGTLDVQRDHVDLIRHCMARLAPGGELIFSTNHRRFKLDTAALADLQLEDISRATLPEDFKRNPRIHHCWRMRPGQG